MVTESYNFYRKFSDQIQSRSLLSQHHVNPNA